MSAAEIIEQIKALPPADKAAVVSFVRTLTEDQEVGKLDSAKRQILADGIFNRYDALFKKLAE